MKKEHKDCNKIDRNNQNYCYIKNVLSEIESKTLKINVLNYLLIHRKKAYFIYKNSKKNKTKYIKQIELLDRSFSFDDMFFVNVDFNDEIFINLDKEKELEILVLLAQGKVTPKEAIIQLSRKNKINSIKAFNIKILNIKERIKIYY